MEHKPKKRMGRPPTGSGTQGEPDRISDYPKLAVTVRPATRARLNAAATIENRPAWQIVDDGVNQYVDRMAEKDRRAVENLAKRAVVSQVRNGSRAQQKAAPTKKKRAPGHEVE
jgi:predicted NAD/FAD-binding protein